MNQEQIQAVLQSTMEGLFQELMALEEVEKADAEEITEEMAEKAEAEIEEEVKMEEDLEEEEKSLNADDVKSIIVEAIKRHVPRLIKKQMETKKKRSYDAKQAIADAVQSSAPAVSKKSKAGGMTSGNSNPSVSVDVQRRFADASWEDMALYVKTQAALQLGNMPDFQKKNVKLGDLVSDDFARVLAFKASKGMERSDYSPDATGQLSIKSAAPWLKADELDATDITNQGLEWVGITYDENVWARARHELKLLDLLMSKGMRVKDVDPGTNQVRFAIDTGSGTVYTRGEANSIDATGRPESTVQVSPFTTDNITMTAKEHALAYIPTQYLTEDTFVDTMSFVNNDMMQTLLEALESTLLNGDTETAASTNVNLIDGTPASGLQKPAYMAWNGMRKNYLVTNTGNSRSASGSLAITDYISTRALFGTTVRNRKDNMLTIIDFDTEVATRKLVSLLTADVAGGTPLATQYSGALPNVLDGVDTYTSGLLAKSNTAGMISATAGNNTTGNIILAYAPYIAYGRKRQVEIKQAEDIYAGTMTFVASIRHTSVHRSADGSVGTYNVGV